MHRLSAAKACFLSDSTENTPKPDDLLQALELGQVIQLRLFFTDFSVHNWIWYGIARSKIFSTFLNEISCYCLQESSSTPKNETDRKYDSVSTLSDRSILSDEMASLCAKLPIYRIKRTTTQRKFSSYS